MGRSRGGLTIKIRSLVDAIGPAIALILTPGQAHDEWGLVDLLDAGGSVQTLIADLAYDGDRLHKDLADRGAWVNIKPMPGRVDIPAYRPFLYRYRIRVERFFN